MTIPLTDPALSLNFEKEVAALYETLHWHNPSILSRIKRKLGIADSALILSKSEVATAFCERNATLSTQLRNLSLAGYVLACDIESGPAKYPMILNIRQRRPAAYLDMVESHLPFLFPYNLRFFFNVNWLEYIANIEPHVADKDLFQKISAYVMDVGYCHLRAANAYYHFCLTHLTLLRVDTSKENLSEMRIYLECLNHAEINIILNKAILDKTLEIFALIVNCNIDGKGETRKKIAKVDKILPSELRMVNHWNAFKKTYDSDDYNKLNNYRTGLVHKVSPKITAVHKQDIGRMQSGLDAIEEIIKAGSTLGFFSVSTILLALIDQYLLPTLSQAT